MRLQFVVRAPSVEDMLEGLAAVGLEVRTAEVVPAENRPYLDVAELPPESWVGRCFAPPFEDIRGHWIASILTPHDDQEMAEKIREFFLCDYDPELTVQTVETVTDPETGETREEVVLKPMDWPVYDLPDVTDPETGKTITGRQRAASRFQI